MHPRLALHMTPQVDGWVLGSTVVNGMPRVGWRPPTTLSPRSPSAQLSGRHSRRGEGVALPVGAPWWPAPPLIGEVLRLAAREGQLLIVGPSLRGLPSTEGVDETGRKGITALAYAAGVGHEDVAALLLEARADPRACDPVAIQLCTSRGCWATGRFALLSAST